MSNMMIPEILIPEEKINLRKWSVIACDQYTSEPAYWQDVERIVGGSPSTYHMILPEAFLSEDDLNDRISHCKAIMKSFIEDGVLVMLPRGLILVERTVNGRTRRGVLCAIDLEDYDFRDGTDPLIRASEATVLDRIPPRVELRREAVLECPHAMILMDDPGDTVIGPIVQKRDSLYKLYDFDLMQEGGRLSGYFVEKPEDTGAFLSSIDALTAGGGVKLAVGDGNHSLVTAKAVWEEAKLTLSPEELSDHPLRYALVELVNLYDPAIIFRPIYRVVRGVETSLFLNDVLAALRAQGHAARLMYTRSISRMTSPLPSFNFVTKETMGRIELTGEETDMPLSILQSALDAAVAGSERASIDYVHGDGEFNGYVNEYGVIGFKVPAMEKEAFFPLLENYGRLPKKSFSIGEADEKRFYFECRLITKNARAEEPAAEELAEEEPAAAPAAEPIAEPVTEAPAEDIFEEEPPVARSRAKKSLFGKKTPSAYAQDMAETADDIAAPAEKPAMTELIDGLPEKSAPAPVADDIDDDIADVSFSGGDPVVIPGREHTAQEEAQQPAEEAQETEEAPKKARNRLFGLKRK